MLTNVIISLAVSLLSILPGNEPVRTYDFTDASVSAADITGAEAAQPDTVLTAERKSFEDMTPAELMRFYTVTGAPRATEPSGPAIRRPAIGISTNLIYDLTYLPHYGLTSIPNVSVEYYPASGHWTYGIDIDFSHWRHYDSHRFNQIHNLTLSTRRYFKSAGSISHSTNQDYSFYGLYLSGSINGAQYGLGWNAKGWEGEGLGASVGIGYKWALGPRMYLDLGASAGFFYSRYDPFVWGNDPTGWYYYNYSGDPADFVRRRMSLSWFGPTRVYISLGINLFDRNNKK